MEEAEWKLEENFNKKKKQRSEDHPSKINIVFIHYKSAYYLTRGMSVHTNI